MPTLGGEEVSDADLQEAGAFAIRVRMLIRTPESWAKIMGCAENLIDAAGVRNWPKDEGNPIYEVSTVAFAIIAARRCARKLPPGDIARVESDKLLDKLVGLVWA